MEVVRKLPPAAQAGKQPLCPGCLAGLRRHAGRPHDRDDRMLLEAGFVGFGDLVQPRHVLVMARQHDLHDLAPLAQDLVAGPVAPLAAGVVHGEPFGEARHDLSVHEAAPLALAHGKPRADIAAEHQFRHLGRLLAAAAVHQLGIGSAGKRRRRAIQDRRGRDPARRPVACHQTAIDVRQRSRD